MGIARRQLLPLFFPELIPFGWGHPDFDVVSVSMQNGTLLNAEDSEPDPDRATLKDDDVYAGNLNVIQEAGPETINMVDNPHLEMMQHQGMESPIPNDIFDESLRYSGVDRPSLSIRRSSPIPQRRGSFEDPHEKIAKLFSSAKATRL